MTEALALLAGYLLGAIPSAYWAGRLGRGIDLREHGSGNIGFTNAWRVLGPAWSIPVLIVDIGKGVLAVLLAMALAPDSIWAAVGAGLLAIIGHTFTIFLGFRGGGKGVATSAGVFLALMPIPFGITAAVFLAILFSTRLMSLASITGAITLVGAGGVLRLMDSSYQPEPLVFWTSVAAAILLIIKHHSNIKRLMQGDEPRMQFSSNASSEEETSE